MAFPRRLLNDGEEVVCDLLPHWSTLAKPVAALVVVLAATIAGALVNHWLGLVLAVVLVAVAGWVGVRVLRRQCTTFAVTTDRLVYRSGVVAKHGKEIPLERVNDIAFHQTLLERIIGTGDLSIESAGAQSRETFGDIPHPASVQNEIYRQMEACAARHAAGHGPQVLSSPLSVPEQLEKLDDLRQRGIITRAEFDAKKQQLLDRI
jgi:membrane protein YdbS with pleckstrin-like domain